MVHSAWQLLAAAGDGEDAVAGDGAGAGDDVAFPDVPLESKACTSPDSSISVRELAQAGTVSTSAVVAARVEKLRMILC